MAASPTTAVLLFLCAARLQLAFGQQQDGTCAPTAQPVVTRFSPPAGTTGSIPEDSTNYTITGAMLGQISTISVEAYFERSNVTLRTNDRMGGNTLVMFHIEDARLRQGEVVNATVLLIPIDPDCETLRVNIKLYSTCKWGGKGGGAGIVHPSPQVLGEGLAFDLCKFQA